jgi:hypothetical protein
MYKSKNQITLVGKDVTLRSLLPQRCDKMPRFEVSENLSKKINDLSRARQSLIEEMEAIMFYDERADATENDELKSVMVHNRDDEKEHFSLLLEFLRRNDPELDKELREILFSKKKMQELGD